MLIPAIKLFGSGLTKPIFAETKLIADMSPGEVRANFVFYIGAGAVASAGIIALHPRAAHDLSARFARASRTSAGAWATPPRGSAPTSTCRSG